MTSSSRATCTVRGDTWQVSLRTGSTWCCERLGHRERLPIPRATQKPQFKQHLCPSPSRQIIIPTRQNPLYALGTHTPQAKPRAARRSPWHHGADHACSHPPAEQRARVHALCVGTTPDDRGGALPRDGLYCGGGARSPRLGRDIQRPRPPPHSSLCSSPPLQVHQPPALCLRLRVPGRVLPACRKARLPRGKPGCALPDRPGSQP